MVMEEEKYNVNILAAEDVNCPGELNFSTTSVSISPSQNGNQAPPLSALSG